MNWIQKDNFNLLHNMRGAKFSLLHSMWGAKCTICEAQSLLICWKSIVLQGKINVPGCCLLCMQTTGCMTEYFTTAGHFYKTSTSATEFVWRQPNIVDSFRSFELACQCMEMLSKRWYHIHSRLCCPSKCTNCTVGRVNSKIYNFFFQIRRGRSCPEAAAAIMCYIPPPFTVYNERHSRM